LKPIITPVVDAAESDVRARAGYPIDVCRSAEPVSVLATRSLAVGMTSLCLGIVYQTDANPAASASIQLLRDGTVTWRRER
jgi:fructoselysine-6-P-deglycase FrlB-like protein